MNTFSQVCGILGVLTGAAIIVGGLVFLFGGTDLSGGILVAAGSVVALLGMLLYQISRLVELREWEVMRDQREQPGGPGVLHDNDPIEAEDSPAPRPRRRSITVPRPPPPPGGLR